MNMNKADFSALFNQWLAYKHAAARRWNTGLLDVYHRALKGYRAEELSKALDSLMHDQRDFPAIATIESRLASQFSDVMSARLAAISKDAEQLVLVAGQLMDYHMGLPFERPTGYVSWLDEVVERALTSARKRVRELIAEGDLEPDQAQRTIISYASGGANVLIKRRLAA